jgi:Metal-dependent amidase/aminoacylase/carboxypeptidase
MPLSPDELFEEAQKMRQTLVDIRRKIHANPELSFKEHSTAALITASLEDMGYAPRTGIAGTGVIADGEGFLIPSLHPRELENACKIAETPGGSFSQTFDIDEEALPIGAAILAASGLSLCQE